MPPIAAARSGQNIRRTCKLMSDISTSPTATKTSSAACGKSMQTVTPLHPKNSKLYKTELCRTWMDCGRCNYGDKCQYAHGEAERRPVSRHPKYKTEFCQPFHQVGYCPYGPRCNFIHNEEQPHPSLQTRRNQANCNGNSKMNSSNSSGDINGTATIITATTAATTTLTFGIWQPHCNSTGDSPAPSSAGSSSDSSIGSGSASLDFDENTGSVGATNGWGVFGAKFSNNVYHLNWPSTSAIATTARTTPLIAQPLLDSALFNDLLELTIDEKKKKAIITKTVSGSAVTCAPSGRLPVFARLSNPSSAS
ncbi:Zinc finger C-x8-C-x5-C-x3-H type (and similar) family protein [Acanthocheilonema viteae]